MIQSEQYHMQPVVHNATKAKQMLIADVKRENTKMWELYPILGRKKKQENLALSAFILEGNIG